LTLKFLLSFCLGLTNDCSLGLEKKNKKAKTVALKVDFQKYSLDLYSLSFLAFLFRFAPHLYKSIFKS